MSKTELIQKVQKWIDANGCTCNPKCLTEFAEQIVRDTADWLEGQGQPGYAAEIRAKFGV